jgi:hypothetical protein
MGDVAAYISPNDAEVKIYSYLRTTYALADPIAKIITAQSGHETNGWTSNVWLKNNNGFGYGYQGNGIYESYGTIQDSIDDVVGWLDRHVPGYEFFTDPAQYAAGIRAAGYYTDSLANYTAGIRRWFDNNLQIAAGVSVAVVVGLVLLYFLVKNK